MGFAPALHAGPVRRARRHEVPGATVLVSDEGRDGRLSRVVCEAFRAARRDGRHGRPADAARQHLRSLRGDKRDEAEQVVIAMANYQKPLIPEFAKKPRAGDRAAALEATIAIRRSCETGGVLIVGAGNSGAEIAYGARTPRTPGRGWLAGRPGSSVCASTAFIGRHILAPLAAARRISPRLDLQHAEGASAQTGRAAEGRAADPP